MLQKFAEEMKAQDVSEVWEIISVIYILGITGSLTFLVFPWNVVAEVGVWENSVGWNAWIRMRVESVAANTDGKLITDQGGFRSCCCTRTHFYRCWNCWANHFSFENYCIEWARNVSAILRGGLCDGKKIEGLLHVPAHETASKSCQKRRKTQQKLLKILL